MKLNRRGKSFFPVLTPEIKIATVDNENIDQWTEIDICPGEENWKNMEIVSSVISFILILFVCPIPKDGKQVTK